MKRSSSRVSVAAVFVLVICFAAPLLLKARQARAPQVPGFAANQTLLNGPPVVYKSEKLAREANNQLELRLDVQRLYALSTELKDDVDHANPDTTLSLTVVKRTQDIEKLAKQIRDRAKR
jgi:spore coat polysaccharide biosynthesis protein SpsF (cytidylyltransferase family)